MSCYAILYSTACQSCLLSVHFGEMCNKAFVAVIPERDEAMSVSFLRLLKQADMQWLKSGTSPSSINCEQARSPTAHVLQTMSTLGALMGTCSRRHIHPHPHESLRVLTGFRLTNCQAVVCTVIICVEIHVPTKAVVL